jgi:hypothetical protein
MWVRVRVPGVHRIRHALYLPFTGFPAPPCPEKSSRAFFAHFGTKLGSDPSAVGIPHSRQRGWTQKVNRNSFSDHHRRIPMSKTVSTPRDRWRWRIHRSRRPSRALASRFSASTSSSSIWRTRAGTRTSTACPARSGRGRQRCGMSREALTFASARSQQNEKQLLQWLWLGQGALRIFQAQTRAGLHGAPEVRPPSALPFPLISLAAAQFIIVRLSPCTGKRKLEATPLTAPLAPSLYNTLGSIRPLPMATLLPLGAEERERAFAACTPAALAQPMAGSAPTLGQILGTLPGGGRLIVGGPARSRSIAAHAHF